MHLRRGAYLLTVYRKCLENGINTAVNANNESKRDI